MKVSVVIPTYKRPHLLRRCLSALIGQNFPDDQFEIIIADNAGETPTMRLVHSVQFQTKIKLTYVSAAAKPGPAYARNIGWKKAQGEIIAFTDDDTLPSEGWLVEGVRVFEEKSSVAAVAGKIIVPLPARPTDYELNESGLASSEFVTANCFCRRWALKIIGGFDEQFTLAWREDSDLQFSLIECGLKIARAEKAIVTHPVRCANFGISILQQHKSSHDALLFKKHPRLFRQTIGFLGKRYYVAVAAFFLAVGLFISNKAFLGSLALVVWLFVTGWFCLARLKRTSHEPLHVFEMIVTSILIPPVAVYWRLYGALKFRVLFY